MNKPKFNLEHLVGHRGVKDEAPENSLGGFDYLKSLDIHRVEIDVHLSKDEVPVVFHDESLHHLCNQRGTIHNKTLKELQGCNCAANFKRWPTTEPIPSLEQVLSAWPQLKEIQIEVKTNEKDFSRLPLLLRKIEALVQHYQLNNSAIITAKLSKVLEQAAINAPSLPLGFVYEDKTQTPDAVALAQDLDCKYLMPHYSYVNAKLMGDAKTADLIVSTWTLNQPEVAKHFVEELGVDTIITDRISVMKAFINSK